MWLFLIKVNFNSYLFLPLETFGNFLKQFWIFKTHSRDIQVTFMIHSSDIQVIFIMHSRTYWNSFKQDLVFSVKLQFKKNLCTRQFRKFRNCVLSLQRSFSLKFILGQKKFWVKKNLGLKKVGSECQANTKNCLLLSKSFPL